MEILAFNKWSTNDVKVTDPGLVNYISLEPKFVPSRTIQFRSIRFHKSKRFIVERLINKIMVPGHKGKKHFKTSYHITGKKQKAYAIVEEVFERIENKTKENPIQVLVRAIENAATREEIISIEYGGARYPKAVECAPQRRVDLALRHMAQGAYHKSFNTKRSIVDTLTEEILAAANLSNNSNAISKKLEVERQADSSR